MAESTKVGEGGAVQADQMGDTDETHHQESQLAHEVLIGFLLQGHSFWSVKLELKQRPKVLKGVLEALRFEHEGERVCVVGGRRELSPEAYELAKHAGDFRLNKRVLPLLDSCLSVLFPEAIDLTWLT